MMRRVDVFKAVISLLLKLFYTGLLLGIGGLTVREL